MRLKDYIHTPLVTCGPDTTLAAAARSMEAHRIGSLVVVDEHGDVVGIITDRDLAIRGVGRELDPLSAVGTVMSETVVTLDEESDAFDAAELMAKHRCRRLPMVDDAGYPTGIVTLDDLYLLVSRQSDDLAHTVAVQSEVVVP